MKTCTFFGHRQIWENLDYQITEILTDLIENQSVTNFYIGNQGDFDKTIINHLKNFKKLYPQITFTVILAYLPTKPLFNVNTLYPEGLENTMHKYAIIKRNQWMIDHSDIVVTYITYPIGGAANARKYAEKKGKKIINIVDNKSGSVVLPSR